LGDDEAGRRAFAIFGPILGLAAKENVQSMNFGIRHLRFLAVKLNELHMFIVKNNLKRHCKGNR
jgi:hypothetical protein